MPWPGDRDIEIFALIEKERERLNTGLQLLSLIHI